MTIFINPGSGPVSGASLGNARKNFATLAEDVCQAGASSAELKDAPLTDEHDGRFRGVLVVDEVPHEVDMPGLSLESVRWMDEPGQDIWDFPRLYVDGSSWVWMFAVGVLARSDGDGE